MNGTTKYAHGVLCAVLCLTGALALAPRSAGAACRGTVRAAVRSASMAPRLETSLPGPWPLFPATNWWNVQVSAAPQDPGPAGYIAYINQGGLKHLHPDLGGTLADGIGIYGMPYIVVDGNQPKKTVN